jgi:hypothetical protein
MKNRLSLRLTVALAAGLILFAIVVIRCYARCYRNIPDSEAQTSMFNEHLMQIEYPDQTTRLVSRKTGKRVTPKLDRIYHPLEENSLNTVFIKNGKRGYLNTLNGNVIIRPQFDFAWQFNCGLAAVVIKNKLGFININGNYVVPPKFPFNRKWYEETCFLFNEGFCLIPDSTGLLGLMDTTGKITLQPLFEEIGEPVNGFRVVKKRGGMYGLLKGRELNLVLPFEYISIVVVADGILCCKENSYQQLLDFNLKVELRNVFDSVDKIYSDNNNASLDEDGDPILKDSGYSTYTVNSKCGLLDCKGKILSPPYWDEIKYHQPGIFQARLSTAYLLIDKLGKPIN